MVIIETEIASWHDYHNVSKLGDIGLLDWRWKPKVVLFQIFSPIHSGTKPRELPTFSRGESQCSLLLKYRPEEPFYVSLCACISRFDLAATKQLKRYVYPVQLGEDELGALNVIVEKLGGSKSGAIREAIKSYAEQLRGMEVVRIRDVSRNQARKEILEFLSKKERAWSSEIADALRLDLSLVNSILQELWSEKRVEPTA